MTFAAPLPSWLEAADASEDGSLTLELLTEATEAAAYAGDYAQAVALGARAGAIEPRSETDRFRVAALSGIAAELAGDHERAAPLLQEAIRRAEQLEDPLSLIWAARMAHTWGARSETACPTPPARSRSRGNGRCSASCRSRCRSRQPR